MKWLLPALFLLFVVSPAPGAPPLKKSPPAKTASIEKKARALPKTGRSWKGDFEAMRERRLIRMLAPYGRTLFYPLQKGRENGITAELARDFERFLNRKYRKQLGNRPIKVALIPTSHDKLMAGILTGLGDIAAGNLAVTDERLKSADFVSLVHGDSVSEVVLTGPGVRPMTRIEDLAGRTIHVRRSAGCFESLAQLNRRFQVENRPVMDLVPVPNALEDEDMMEMVNAGLLDVIVVEDWKADMWRKILPGLIVNKHVAVRSGVRRGWAVRKNSPRLLAELNDFYRDAAKNKDGIEYRVVRANRRTRQIYDPTGPEEWRRFESMLTLFRKYGEKFGFDPLMLAAQGYQESRLRQNARGSFGAIGVMQLLPSTGASMKVGNIRILESNIHAGAKYMHYLLKQYFPDAAFSEPDRTLFAFAAYNAGPTRISKIRKEAAKSGLDPDQWFNHVEMATARSIGSATTTHVRNIYKYYVAYKLALEAGERRREAHRKRHSP